MISENQRKPSMPPHGFRENALGGAPSIFQTCKAWSLKTDTHLNSRNIYLYISDEKIMMDKSSELRDKLMALSL